MSVSSFFLRQYLFLRQDTYDTKHHEQVVLLKYKFGWSQHLPDLASLRRVRGITNLHHELRYLIT